jgi:hypothetical protein
MNWSLLPRSILMVWLMIPISACQDSQDKTSASTPESSAFRSALNFGPSELRRAGSDARCMGIMGRINPEWDDGDLRHMCSWGADVSCLSCWASNHPNASPSNILDNCLPNENGDDSDLYGNGCYNGPGADYGGPYTPPQPPSQPGFPTDPNFGRNCGGRLAELRPNWSPGQLNAACSGADAECVVSTARQRPNWSPGQLNAACSAEGQPQPPPQFPPHPPQDPNIGRNCGGRLAALRPNWSPGQLNAACSGADAECVVSTARQRPNWSAGQLNAACTAEGQPLPPPQFPPHLPQDPNFGRNCGGRLAALRPNWSAGQLSAACSGADAECVVSTARQRPNWSAGQLNAACTSG